MAFQQSWPFSLAATDPFGAIRRHLQGSGSPAALFYFVMLAGVIALIWGIVIAVEKRKQSDGTDLGLEGLFDELCRAHRLDRIDRALLSRIARDLTKPSIVFVEPDYILRYGESHGTDAVACRALHRKLFEQPTFAVPSPLDNLN